MELSKLSIVNFKSIETADLSFAKKLNCFVGNNGMGKTNILDAIHYLAFTKSHLSISDAFAINRDSEFAVLDAIFDIDNEQETKKILIQINRNARKIIKRNKKEYERISEHIGQVPLVIVSPQDNQLIIGASEMRRRFVDKELSQRDAKYLNLLSKYNKLLEQRNSLLKNPHHINSDLLMILDMQMAEAALYVYQKRKEFIENILPIFDKIYHFIDGGKENVSLKYQSRLTDSDGDIMPIFSESLAKDKVLGYTSEGIHKDDIEMSLDGDPIKKVASQGQIKTYLIALKLSQYMLLEQNTKSKPILLLDDIFDRLDSDRVERIVKLVSGDEFGQIFISDTNRSHLDRIVQSWDIDYKIYKVENGEIRLAE